MYYILIILVVVFIYFNRRRNTLEKQAELFNRLLYVEKNPEKYVTEVDKLLLKSLSERERNINLIQKTTGLFYIGEFDESIRILTEDVNKIPPNWQTIYYHNLLLSLYLNGDYERANDMLSEVKNTLDMYYKRDYNKVTIELIYAVSDFYSGNIQKCKDFFDILVDVARNDYRIALGYYFTSKINELEEKIDDAEDNLEKARTYGQGSFIEKL
ncbi:MAG: hypothetical protein AB7V48_11570 [Sedimentibacter sp.]